MEKKSGAKFVASVPGLNLKKVLIASNNKRNTILGTSTNQPVRSDWAIFERSRVQIFFQK